MFGYISTALGAVLLLWASRKLVKVGRHIAIVKGCGLPYLISPVDGFSDFIWTLSHDFVIRAIRIIPGSDKWLLPMILEPYRGWNFGQELRERLGEAFFIVSPGQIYLNVASAEAINEITARRNDFLKPSEFYYCVELFGPSILSSEGENWKSHRKIVASAFSEKSNALVWKESLNQVTGLLKFWSALEGNSLAHMKVNNTAPETTLMTLHVISGAGFDVRQIWNASEEKQLGAKTIAGFNSAKLQGNHTLAFKDCINTLLRGIIWLAVFPKWFLNQSPFEIHKKLMRSYLESAEYFKELIEYRIELLERGVEAEKGTMDLMGPLVRSLKTDSEDSKGLHLTTQDVIANLWIFLFAGHETTGNTLHFALLFLAIDLDTQAQLQGDIDSIMGSSSPEDWTYETDMGRLYQSLVGATLNETLRLTPALIDIPKVVRGAPKSLKIDGKTITVPAYTYIHLSAAAVQRNPRYWPHDPSKITSKTHDLDDFVPQRWLRSRRTNGANQNHSASNTAANIDGLEKVSFESNHGLFTPVKGAFIPFSDGARACPGRRFAQVEITAVLSRIFKTHTVELEVSQWASDAAVERMGKEERRVLYETAKTSARKEIRESEPVITLQMMGRNVPVRFVERGKERFMDCYVS